MRVLVERWYLGPIVALVALYVCFVGSIGTAGERRSELAFSQIDRVYSLAKQGKYDEIQTSGLASEISVKYLKMQEQCFGRITAWSISSVNPSGLTGTAWRGTAQVSREKATFHESLGGLDPHLLHISLASWENDLDNQRQVGDAQAVMPGDTLDLFTVGEAVRGDKVATADQAIAAARGPIHEMDAAEAIIPPLRARETPDFWVVEETVRLPTESERRFFVISKSGEQVERVRATGHSDASLAY